MTALLPAATLILLALSLFWATLLSAIEHTCHSRRHGEPRAVRFPAPSLTLANSLCRALTLGLGGYSAALLAGVNWAWLGLALAGAAHVVLGDFLARALARRYPDALLNLANTLLRLPLHALYPVACLFKAPANLLLRSFARRHAAQPANDAPQEDDDADNEDAPVSAASPLAGSIQALERMTVNDILVPRSEVDGLNLDEPLTQVMDQLIASRHTRLPVFRGDINQVEKVLNTRQIAHLLPARALTDAALAAACYDAYFIPENTPLHVQLLNFHKAQRRMGMVVDEYGDVMGLVTLEDILEEIVGEFEHQQVVDNPHVHPQPDGRYVLDGAIGIRELNKALGWHLPSDGPRTLNGLITEALESIPDSSVCLKIGRYRLEILDTEDNRVSKVLAWHQPSVPLAL